MASEQVRSTSVHRRHWVRQWMLLTCLAWIATFTGTGGANDLPLVTGATWHRPRRLTVQMRVREPPRKGRRQRSGSSGGKASDGSQADAEARKLTRKMKDVKSATELLDLLDGVMDGPTFNYIHASAAYHSLATWKRRGGLAPSEKASPVWLRLAARVQDMALEGQLDPRAVANVLWSFGQLSNVLEVPKSLVMALVKSCGEKASGMAPQALSNSLLACVQLKRVAPEVLTVVPQLAAQILSKAEGMKPQDLSNNLWASAHLKDDASREDVAKIVAATSCQIPSKAIDMTSQELSNSLWAAAQLKDIAPGDVKEIVPAMVAQIQDIAGGMNPQALSNSLEALVLLQDSVLEVACFLAAAPGSKNDFVGLTAGRFSIMMQSLTGKDLKFATPTVLWACARLNLCHDELLASVAQCMGSSGTLSVLPDWGLCVLLWSYDVLDPDDRFAKFKQALESERLERGLSEADVSESQFGRFDWTRAKV